MSYSIEVTAMNKEDAVATVKAVKSMPDDVKAQIENCIESLRDIESDEVLHLQASGHESDDQNEAHHVLRFIKVAQVQKLEK